jgi:hypothetical protein
VLADLGRDEPGAGGGGEASEQPRLAARPRADIQPVAVRPVDGQPGQRSRRQLAGFVLNACPALRHRTDSCRVAVAQVAAECRPAGGLAACGYQLLLVSEPWHGAQLDSGALIVRGEGGLSLGQAAI